MAVGASALLSGFSYLAVGREIALGTYNTCTAGLDFISCSLKTMKENKVLELVERSRTFSKTFAQSKIVEGEFEYYYQPRLDACNFILQNFFGGTVTSVTATGETAGAGASSAITHTFALGNMDQSYPSLCLNLRKGPLTTGKVFQYSGARVNELMFSSEMDEPLKCKTAVVCVDSTINSNDVESVSLIPTSAVLSFDSGRLSAELNFSSLTSSAYWHIQSVEFGWNNSLKKDSESRRIGSDLLQVLPPGIAQFSMSAVIRYDTTTAYDAMLNATQFSLQLEFLGATLPGGSAIRQGIKFNFPKVIVTDGGDPEIGGPDEILQSTVEFQILRDDSSATGYAVQALVTNQKANYA